MAKLSIELGPTQKDFCDSDAFETMLVSSRGGGKTDAGLWKVCVKSLQQDAKYRPMLWACVRDTWSNLERTTLKSINEPLPGSIGTQIRKSGFHIESRDGGRELTWMYLDEQLWTILMFGCDSPADMAKFQSLQLGGFWLEESAPAAVVDIGGGIGENVYLMGITSLRQPLSTHPFAMITENYPDSDHWSWKRFHNPNVPDKALFEIPNGENIHLPAGYLERSAAALANNPSLLARLVRGIPGDVEIGETVMPEYNSRVHLSPIRLYPVPGIEVIRMWDGWHHPSCIFTQVINGQLRIIDGRWGENEGVKQLIQTSLIPLMNSRFTGVSKWRDIGDPSMADGDQSDTSTSASNKIESLLHTTFEKGESRWEPRRDSIKSLLSSMTRGVPSFLVSNDLTFIDKGLRVGWHYKRLSSGQVQRNIPVKNEYCVDEETECLTRAGWKTVHELREGDRSYGYDLEKDCLVDDEIRKINYFSGNHSVRSFQNLQTDIVVTPGHRMVVRRRVCSGKGEYHIGPFIEGAENIDSTTYSFLRSAALEFSSRIPKDKEYSDDFIRLCAWVMTEGHYRPDGSIEIGQSESMNPAYCRQIEELLSVFPNTWVKHFGNGRMFTGRIKWEIANLIKIAMPNKYPSPEFISQMTKTQMRTFIFESMKGDGSKTNRKVLPAVSITRNRDLFFQDETLRLSSVNPGELDSMQHISTLLGIRSIKKPSLISFTRLPQYSSWRDDKAQSGEVNGVWCPETTTHSWVARRNGQVFITGNSHPCDAITYGIHKIFGRDQVELPVIDTAVYRTRANGYGMKTVVNSNRLRSGAGVGVY